jgi:hypothetical protein
VNKSLAYFFLFPLCKVLLASDANDLGAFAKT